MTLQTTGIAPNVRSVRSGADFLAISGNRFGDGSHAVEGSRKPTINSGLENDLDDLLFAYTVSQSPTNMNPELMRSVQCCEHAKIEDTAFLLGQAWPLPDIAPSPLRHHFLKSRREVRNAVERSLHMRVTEHLTPHRDTFFEQFCLELRPHGHRGPFHHIWINIENFDEAQRDWTSSTANILYDYHIVEAYRTHVPVCLKTKTTGERSVGKTL